MKNIASLAALAWHYLWSRPLAAVLNLLLLSLGLASITLVLLVSAQVDRAFERDLAGIDLVVGAKGSPLQLILAGVFHIDVPPGNIPLAEAQALQNHPQVAQLIPLSLGDSFRGFRIVGTTADYLAHYGATHCGRPWLGGSHAGGGRGAGGTRGWPRARRAVCGHTRAGGQWPCARRSPVRSRRACWRRAGACWTA
jgi:hypothetical protein